MRSFWRWALFLGTGMSGDGEVFDAMAWSNVGCMSVIDEQFSEF